MRTNVVIDDELIALAMTSTGLTTKKAVIEEALRTLDPFEIPRGHAPIARPAPLGRKFERDAREPVYQ
jgi:putative antitoxin of VapBC-like toxin-antitoxin system